MSTTAAARQAVGYVDPYLVLLPQAETSDALEAYCERLRTLDAAFDDDRLCVRMSRRCADLLQEYCWSEAADARWPSGASIRQLAARIDDLAVDARTIHGLVQRVMERRPLIEDIIEVTDVLCAGEACPFQPDRVLSRLPVEVRGLFCQSVLCFALASGSHVLGFRLWLFVTDDTVANEGLRVSARVELADTIPAIHRILPCDVEERLQAVDAADIQGFVDSLLVNLAGRRVALISGQGAKLKSIVERLEREGVTCRVIEPSFDRRLDTTELRRQLDKCHLWYFSDKARHADFDAIRDDGRFRHMPAGGAQAVAKHILNELRTLS